MHSNSSSLQYSMLSWCSAQASKDTFHYNRCIQQNRVQESPPHGTLPNLCRSFQIELEVFKVFLSSLSFKQSCPTLFYSFTVEGFSLLSSIISTCSSTSTTGNNKANPIASGQDSSELSKLHMQICLVRVLWINGHTLGHFLDCWHPRWSICCQSAVLPLWGHMNKFSEEKEDPKKSKIRVDLVSFCQQGLVFLLVIWYVGLASSKLGTIL